MKYLEAFKWIYGIAGMLIVLSFTACADDQSAKAPKTIPSVTGELVDAEVNTLDPDAIAKEAQSGCAVQTSVLEQNALLSSGKTLKNPPVFDFTGGAVEVADLLVSYQSPILAGCKTRLRQYAGSKYDGRPVAPTMLIRPDQTYQAEITNRLPKQNMRMHGGEHFSEVMGAHGGSSTVLGYIPPEATAVNHNVPGDFNVTNLHTHGWHVSPVGNSDNVFVSLEPCGSGPCDPYLQQVKLPANHVAGTFWYHAHKHGSTALQVASGMAGALIVVDQSKGLDAVPQIAAAKDHIMIMQQLAYDEHGIIEDYTNLNQRGYGGLNRPVFINGQAYPVVEMQVGEVQRWRFVHAGITDGINPGIVKNLGDTTTIPMHEIAQDGLPIDQLLSINNVNLSPGYRVDVLAQLLSGQVEVGDTLYLIDTGQSQFKNNNPQTPNFRYILAQIKVVAGTPTADELPSSAQIAAAKGDYIYGTYKPGHPDPFEDMGPLNDVTQQQLTGKTQVVHYVRTNSYTCPEVGGACTPCLDANNKPVACTVGDPPQPTPPMYMSCDSKDRNGNWVCMNFNPSAEFTRTLILDTASKWEVSGALNDGGTRGQNNHTFHVHVNPFQVQRKWVDGSTGELGEQWIWKDTLKAPAQQSASQPQPFATLKSRYTLYTGAFVQHCHVLNHEDQGMMQVVEIEPTAQDLQDIFESMNHEDVGPRLLEQLKK
ncbi:MAG: multicopper oxidase domain-containing protein [Pseudomonadota bacterium]